MLVSALEHIVAELKAAPFTLITVVALAGVSLWGWANYARSQDLATLKTAFEATSLKIDRVLALQLAQSIRSTHTQICAIEANSPVKQGLQTTLDALQHDYRVLTGSNYPLEDP